MENNDSRKESISKKIKENLDLIVAVGGMLFGLFIISLYFIINLRQLDIGFVIFSACLIYTVFRNRFKKVTSLPQVKISQRQKILLNIIFFIIFAVTVLLWYNQLYQRPLAYFILLSILVGILAVEILCFDNKKDHAGAILLKIFALSANIRAGIFYNFPSLIGYDTYQHANIADLTAILGFVQPYEISSQYAYYPILHIFIAITEMMCKLGIKDAMFFSIGAISIISTIFIYFIGKKIAGGQIGLLAALLFNVTNCIIVRGITNITAGSLVLCYFMMILYLIFKEEHKTINASIIIFLTLLMIITHQLTVFTSFIALTSIYFGKYLYNFIHGSENIDKSWLYVNKHYVLIFAVAMLAYWMHSYASPGRTFFDYVATPFIRVLQSGGEYGSNVLIVGQEYPMYLWEILLLHSSYLILPFFAIGGILLGLSFKDNKKFSIVIAAIVLYALVYGIPLFGISNLLTDRWLPILSVFLVLLASVYVLKIVKLINSNRSKIFIIFTIAVVFSFLMVTTPGINKDNPIVAKDTTVRNQYTNSEMSAMKTIVDIWNGQIRVDSALEEGFRAGHIFYGNNINANSQNISVPEITTFALNEDYSNMQKESGVMNILRKSTLREPVLVIDSKLAGVYRAQLLPQDFFDSFESNKYDKLYDNGGVLGYCASM